MNFQGIGSERAERAASFSAFDVTGARRVTHFGYGLPGESTFDWPLLKGASETLSRAGRDVFQYTDAAGFWPLRRAIGGYYGMEPDEVLVTSGATAAMALIADALVEPGDRVLVEDPGYLGAIKLFKTAGAELVHLPLDAEGVALEALAAALKPRSPQKPKFFYTMPLFHNPTGSVTSEQRRKDVLALAEGAGVPIVQDIVYERLSLRPSNGAVYPLSRTITIGSASKILGPGLRIGWIVAAADVVASLSKLKGDGGTNPVCSYLVAQLLESTNLVEHVLELRKLYSAKMLALARLLEGCSFCEQPVSLPTGGFSFWFRWKSALDVSAVRRELEESHRVVVPAGAAYGPSSDLGGRLCFSFLPMEQIIRGIEAVDEVAARRGSGR